MFRRFLEYKGLWLYLGSYVGPFFSHIKHFFFTASSEALLEALNEDEIFLEGSRLKPLSPLFNRLTWWSPLENGSRGVATSSRPDNYRVNKKKEKKNGKRATEFSWGYGGQRRKMCNGFDLKAYCLIASKHHSELQHWEKTNSIERSPNTVAFKLLADLQIGTHPFISKVRFY